MAAPLGGLAGFMYGQLDGGFVIERRRTWLAVAVARYARPTVKNLPMGMMRGGM